MEHEAFDLAGRRIWVAGHRGMVGSAIVRRLADEPVAKVIGTSSGELDLTRQGDTQRFVADTKPDVAIIAAARVGGIHANRTRQADFLYDNLMIAANCIEACRVAGVDKVVVLGSSCIYPARADQPMVEHALMSGPLEPTNEGYSVAKIAALTLAKMYRRQYGMDAISLMPTNLYGPGDNFDLQHSRVVPALLRKFHEAAKSDAASVQVWGTGQARREFLHVDDLADAVVFSLRHVSQEEHVNVGTGRDLSIGELAAMIADVVGYSGEIEFDVSMPDGTPRKLLDVTALSDMGWHAKTPLRDGLASTYRWFVDHYERARGVAINP